MEKSDAPGLYQVPGDYEALLGADGSDEGFYLGLAAEFGGPVLDLGCGGGRLSLALAAAGQAVTGVDASAPMLARARAAAQARGLSVEWRQSRWQDLDLPRRYALALLPYNGLQHLLRDEDLVALSRALHACLLPGARWALDLHVPQPAILARDPDTWFPVSAGPRTESGAQVTDERSAYDAPSRVLTQHWRLREADGDERGLRLALRQFEPDELQAFFRAQGWAVEGLYESFDRRPLGAQALRQVWVLRTAA
jgi:SAM-dependent methyltransferase